MATPTDGQYYCQNKVVPSTNADNDLGTPLPMVYNQAAVAVVELTVAGGPATNSTFVVMQTDMGDGNWVDVAWIVFTGTTNGLTLYVLSGGSAGANAFAFTRAAGAAPASNSSNQMPLGARVRFVSRSQLTGGTSPTVTATILVKQMGLR